MKTLKGIVAAIASCVLLCGCMGEREYMLRKMNATNQANHPTTYEVATLTGPLNLEAGGSILIRAANQPFQPLDVPDGVATQRLVIRDAITGAVIGYGLYQAGAGGSVKNSHNTTAGGNIQ